MYRQEAKMSFEKSAGLIKFMGLISFVIRGDRD